MALNGVKFVVARFHLAVRRALLQERGSFVRRSQQMLKGGVIIGGWPWPSLDHALV